jgi:sirohydrochlorin ferrochelatase
MSGAREKTAVILMGHGSRVPEASRSMERVAEALRSSGEHEMVVICHMSRGGPFFPEALKKCVDGGAVKIVLIPYFLHMGLHMRLDVPEMMREEAGRYPTVKVVFGKSLGYDERLVDLVAQRIGESMDLPDVRNLPKESKGKYPLAEGELEFVAMPPEEAEKYQKEHGHNH